MEPSAQPAQPICSIKKPRSSGPPNPSCIASGATSKTVPARPTSIARMVGPCNRSPPGISASTPTIQKGDTVIKTDANPLGTHCSAKTRHPVPVPIMMTPYSAVYQSSRPRGKMRFRKIRHRQQNDSGDGVAQSHQHRRRHRFQRDANAQVRGAPEEADRGQRQIRLKVGMARQNSG